MVVPFNDVVVEPAVVAKAPEGFRGDDHAWGCYQAHRKVWKDAWAGGVDTLLVFEDDVILAKNFASRLAELLDSPDWDVMMLGGQHVRPPAPAGNNLWRCRLTARSHAYMLRAGAIEALASAPEPTHNFSLEWHGWLPKELAVMAPIQWLAGQSPDSWWQR